MTTGYARCACVAPKYFVQRLAHRQRTIDRHHRAGHHFIDVMPLQRIDAVLTEHMPATTRDLLREDRAGHHDDGESIGHRAREQRGQETAHVMRQPEREDDWR